jgi:hypothetical protein
VQGRRVTVADIDEKLKQQCAVRGIYTLSMDIRAPRSDMLIPGWFDATSKVPSCTDVRGSGTSLSHNAVWTCWATRIRRPGLWLITLMASSMEPTLCPAVRAPAVRAAAPRWRISAGGCDGCRRSISISRQRLYCSKYTDDTRLSRCRGQRPIGERRECVKCLHRRSTRRN